jgi:hypothetical protein
VYDPDRRRAAPTFSPAGPRTFRDRETDSRWSVAGVALEGPLAGRRLTSLPYQEAFWFAWVAFQPDTARVKQ